LVCPVCESEHTRPGDWCSVCGTYLGFLKRHPRRVGLCVVVSILLGFGLFSALAWQVFAPMRRGLLPAEPGQWFWWGFVLGTFFLAFGLAARRQLAHTLRRLFRPPGG